MANQRLGGSQFAADFAVMADARIVALKQRDAELVDQAWKLAMSDSPADHLDELRRLLADSEVIAAQCAELAQKKAVYFARVAPPHARPARPEAVARPVRTSYPAGRHITRPVATPLKAQFAPITCSLASAEPPWQWSWGDGFVPFSEMQPTDVLVTDERVWGPV